MNKRLFITFALLIILYIPTANAETYVSQKNHFSITFNGNWSRSYSPYYGKVELMLKCTSGVCSKDATVTVSAFYEEQLHDAGFEQFLRFARSMLGVTNFKILKENRTRLGAIDVYEVIMKYSVYGLERIRHDYWTFNKGYVYSLSYIGFPENHDTDLKEVKKVFYTFKFTK